MLYSELKCKDVVNIKDCKKVGKICNLEINECDGCILKIMVPGATPIFSFLRCDKDIAIPYNKICKIGPDIILVDIDC